MTYTVNEIARRADKLDKTPKKDDVFAEVLRMMDSGIDELALAKLYRYFTPPVTKIKTQYGWLVKARAKKDARDCLTYAYSDGSETVATDGCRLHVLYEPMPAGYHDDNGVKIHDDDWARYPNYRVVVPTDKEPHFEVNISDLEIISLKDYRTKAAYKLNDDLAVNKTYLDEAMQLSKSCKVLVYGATDLASCGLHTKIKVIHDEGYAVVMALKI